MLNESFALKININSKQYHEISNLPNNLTVRSNTKYSFQYNSIKHGLCNVADKA